ncbi:unnamed protein product [Rotaria socialis]|uniref:DNA-dependent protein kinase catalytic subunit n=1 Tax=Rotaria socialis TaxID=392032 RepID=A0A820NLP8_9BILA|nr:unnamed protein product [Rotaria socialis]CAF4389746.1 unnamed protein product [Rotaria socialis]
MTEASATSNFDNYILELHGNLDRLREIPDVDEQCAVLIGDLAQAYSEHPSPMQTAICLSALFSGQKNILTFLRRASSKPELKRTKIEILQFLKFFVESASNKILPYAVELKTVLLIIFNVDSASDVRAGTFPVLSQLIELSAGFADMESEIDKMATTFIDLIGLQSTKTTATIKGLSLAFLGLLCKCFPEHMRKYSDPLLIGQYLKYLHEHLVRDVVKFEMLIAAGAMEGLIYYLVNFVPSAISVVQPTLIRNKSKDDEKRIKEEQIRCESDLKRVYIYASRAIQTQDQTNLNRYALVKAGLELFAQHSTLFTEYLYDDYPEILRCLRAWNIHDNYDVKKIAQRAYDTFLLGVANALKEPNIKTQEQRRRAVQTFQYFIKEFRDKIDSPELEIRDLAMGIRGYGIFANACKLYGTEEDVKFMFVGLIQRCEQIAMPTISLSQAADVFDERFYALPNLLDALSAIIIEMTNIGEEFLGPLERLTVMTIDYYPRYQPKPQATTCSSVIKMILALQTKPTCYKPFLTRIVNQAIIRCCSHPLKSTVEQQLEDVEPDLPEEQAKSLLAIGKTITYENYIPLWKIILNVTSLKEFDTSTYPIFDRQNMLVSLYDEMIDSILHIIDRLDLSVDKEKTEDENDDGTTTTDPVFGMKPMKPKDFEIFYNLVDFCQDLLPEQSPDLFQKWIFRFLYEIISASTKYPLVSGIYRFTTLVMNICLKLNFFKSDRLVPTTRGGIEMMDIDINENEQVASVCTLVRRFAHEVLSRQKQYRDDLLVACLQFIISLPSECIDYDFADYVPTIQLALSIGLTYLPLAEQTINSLERWSQSTSLNLSNYYDQILPYLDDFLRLSHDQGDDVNVRAIISTLQEKTRMSSRSKHVLPTRMLKKAKQIKHLFEDSDIRRVQFRILKYLGSIGNRTNHYLIDNTSNYLVKEAVAWDNENHLTFNVPFDDIKPTIHLDIFLPRIIDLASHCSDRQTKITACELLQSIMLYMIGKSANNRSNAAASYEKLYARLFPAVLELSCDSDTFTKTLFTTFMIQIIHWFTKNQNYENPETMSMLDTFMDGMISGRNASIRDFSGVCLKEFLKWAVKHAGGFDKPAYLKNATSILKRILSFSMHPNTFKRLGSALAWNSIYTLFRESETLIDVYTFQLLYVFVESLAIAQGDDPSLGTQQQAIGALSHVQRIIKEKSSVFIKETPKRHRPPSWTEATLEIAVRWLLRQCGRIETESRRKCIELVCTFIPLLPGVRSIREYFDLKVKSDGNVYFIERFEGSLNKENKTKFKANLANQPCLTDMTEQFSIPTVYQWLDTVIASLDCYTWAFSQGYLNPLLFQDNHQQSHLIVALLYFITKVSMSTLYNIVTYFPPSTQTHVFTPTDISQFETAKCTVIVRLLNFITALWSKYPQDTLRAIDSSFYNNDLTTLILTCVFNPTQLGFDINNEEINKKLPERIRSLLKSMTTHLPDQLLQSFYDIALKMTKTDGLYSVTKQLDQNPIQWPLIFTITRGLRLLHDVRLLPRPQEPDQYAKELWMTMLAKMINHEEDFDKANLVLTVDTQRGLQSLFDYIIYLGIKPTEVLPHFFQSNRIHTDSGMTTIGTYLLTLFKHQITSWLGTTPHFITDNVGETNTIEQCRPAATFLSTVLDLCSREKDIRQKYGPQFIDGIYTCWPQFSSLYYSTNVDDKLLIVTLLTKTFIIDSHQLILHEQFNNISQMYLLLLTDKQLNLTFKIRLLDLLAFFASIDLDESLSEEKRKKWSNDLCRTLRQFTSDCFPLKSTEFSVGTQEYHDFQAAIRKILSALELSSSFILLELLIWMLCCEQHHAFEEEILFSISRFVINLNNHVKQTNLLDYVYSIIFGKNSLFRTEHRLNALEKLILKILTSVRKITLIEFYKKYVCTLVIDELDVKIDLSSQALISILINKVCTYRLIDHMYTILNKDDIFGLNSLIAKTFYEHIKKQEEARKILNVELPISAIKVGPIFDGKELTKHVITRSRGQFVDGKLMKSMELILAGVNTNEKQIKLNLTRALAASSFNCLISLLICTQTEAKLYKAFIFDANPAKDEYVFENLIDSEQKYTFPLELERYYKKDKRTLLNILCKKILTTSKSDNPSHQQRLSSTPRYLSSQYLFGSSLTDELAVFDFTSAAVNQQHNDLSKSLSSSLSDNTSTNLLSQKKLDDDKPALIEGSDDEIGSEFIDMEMDELNLHPCMVPMVCLLKHMETNGIIPINDNFSHSSEMPLWMICVYKKFSDPLISFNIKLFLMRLIIHTHTIFKPYARYWLTPIIQMCNQMFENSSEGLNTFIIDTIVILLSWHKQAIPSELDSIAVQRLIEHLFSNCSHRNPIVMKSNLDLIKKLIECWKERVHSPTVILYKLISEPDLKSKQNAIGLSLVGILLANEILPYYVAPAPVGNLPPVTTGSSISTVPNDLTEDKFNDTILKNMKNTYRNIYAAAAEVIGMLLNVKRVKSESTQRLLEQLSLILKWHNSQGLSDTYVTCIYSIQKHYPPIVEKTVMNKLIFGLKKMYGDIKIECLESLIANITEFDSAYMELRAAGILDILIHKDFGIRGVALRLLHKLLPKLTHEQLYEIAQILFVDGPNECQIWTLEIYKWMYDYITNYLTKAMKTSITPLSEMFYHHVREQLLQLLSSKNEFIRVNCRNFWCDAKRLSTSSQHRLLALVDQLYSIKTENEYLNYCTNFLLERTTHSPDYNHFIFENPLDKCLFQEFPLACNWRQRHHTYMMPLFTLQSQSMIDPSVSTATNLMTMDPVQFMQTLSDNNNNPDQQQSTTNSPSPMILQTQEMSGRQQFLPTQMLDNNNGSYNWLKQTSTLDSINTFALPTLGTQTKKTTSLIVDVDNTNKKPKINAQSNTQNQYDEQDDDIFRLKRRFLKDSGQLHAAYFARRQNEKKEDEKQFLNEIKLKQENQVEKYRTYRIGELPDIQIRYSDIIIPLQALAQYDNHIARLLYASLFTSILNALEDKLSPDEYYTIINTIQHRFDVMLSQSEIFYPSFVAAILDIVLSKPEQIQISAQYISASTIASHLESVGILTIECFIRLNQMNESQLNTFGPLKKKLKSDPDLNNQLYKKIDQWLELAKCYRSLANYDDVRGIFSQTPGLKSITLRAIEEESHADFLLALNSYVTALEQYPLTDETANDPILELEHEFWTQSMLNCCNQLNNWTIMSKHIFIDNTTFDTLWSNAHQLNYLMPYAIRAKLKLLISGNEKEQLEQDDLCQFFNNLSTNSNNTVATANVETTFVKRSYIEKQYPFELATFFLYQKDFDRAKYYIQYAKEQFLLRWSTLSRLSEYGRKTTIQLIQPYYELDQFLVFIEQNLPLLKSLENRYLTNNKSDTTTRDLFLERVHNDLLSQWQLPDVIRSSVQTWDDIVTNRSLFLDILDELIGGPRMTFTSRLKATEFDPLLVDYKVQSLLDMSYCALRQRNFKLALTKLNETRNRLDLCQNPLIKSIYWNEIYCDVHLKRHQIQSSTSTLSSLLSTSVAKELKKMEIKIYSLKIIDQQTAQLNSTYIQLNSQFCRTVIDFLLAHPQAYHNYEHDEKIPQAKQKQLEMFLYGLENNSQQIQQADCLIYELFNKCVNILKDNIEKQETDLQSLSISIRQAKENILSRDYNELASVCDDYLRRYENNEDENNLMANLFTGGHGNDIAKLVVKSVLLSMKYGSNEGVKRFSRLLQIVDLYPDTMDLIADKLQEIPCWMFFDCLYQITAHLDKPIALKLYPLIEQIVQLYPQSIVYPFKLSYETLQNSITDPILKHNLDSIHEKLNRYTPLVNEFIEALNQLNPQQQFDAWSKELFHLLTNDPSTRDIDKLKSHLRKLNEILLSNCVNLDETNDNQYILVNTQESLNSNENDNTSSKSKITSIRILFKNTVEKEFNDLFGRDGELFSTVSLGDARLVLGNISLKLKTIIQDKSNINDYSTWFSSTFQQQNRILDKSSIRELEIPGQYSSKKKPLMEHHIKIVGFDEKLLVLHSLRLPKRITIRGNDENDYRFLVKAGEDIRQDQRIEALFSIMNDLYDNDPNCNQSNSAHIAVRTYKVIPMSSKLGMIEWLDNTRPLKDLIEESYNSQELDVITNQGQHPRKLYQDYVTTTYQTAKPAAKTANNTLMYAELFLSLTKDQVREEFNRIQSVVPADLLRRAYYKIANSHEGFYTLRRQFITSYAVLCTSQYILGIGDRHQSNFLIDTTSGQIIGIDFGSAFNAATIHLPVPELIPIRLTRQLTQLMSPVGTAGLFRATMIQTMNALRENSDLLLSTMDVFIKEPLMEWMEHALRTSKQVAQNETNIVDSDDTYAKDRIKSARLKLNGINPAVITGSDLKLNNFLRSSNLKEARRRMEKVVAGDRIETKRAQILLQYNSSRHHKLTVDEQIDCIIDQATDVDILGRSWAGLETFM